MARDKFRIRRMDAMDYLRSLKDESVDLIVTDPAYESLERHRAAGQGSRSRLKKNWFPIFPNERFKAFFAELFRVLKRGTHAYMLCDQETMFIVKPLIEAAGFHFWKAIIWDKKVIGMGYHYRCRHEMVLFFEKKGRKNRMLNSKGIPDILEFRRIHRKYPTEKPVGLLEVLIRNSSNVGDVVVDPFCGSGSTGEAALNAGRLFRGCDIQKKSVRLARARLSENKLW